MKTREVFTVPGAEKAWDANAKITTDKQLQESMLIINEVCIDWCPNFTHI